MLPGISLILELLSDTYGKCWELLNILTIIATALPIDFSIFGAHSWFISR